MDFKSDIPSSFADLGLIVQCKTNASGWQRESTLNSYKYTVWMKEVFIPFVLIPKNTTIPTLLNFIFGPPVTSFKFLQVSEFWGQWNSMFKETRKLFRYITLSFTSLTCSYGVIHRLEHKFTINPWIWKVKPSHPIVKHVNSLLLPICSS